MNPKCGIINVADILKQEYLLHQIELGRHFFMLVSAKDMMDKARDGKYAVGQFNINNLEWTKAILNTAQKLNSPVILGVSGGAGKYMTVSRLLQIW